MKKIAIFFIMFVLIGNFSYAKNETFYLKQKSISNNLSEDVCDFIKKEGVNCNNSYKYNKRINRRYYKKRNKTKKNNYKLSFNGNYSRGIFSYKLKGKVYLDKEIPHYYKMRFIFNKNNTIGISGTQENFLENLLSNVKSKYTIINQSEFQNAITNYGTKKNLAREYYKKNHKILLQTLLDEKNKLKKEYEMYKLQQNKIFNKIKKISKKTPIPEEYIIDGTVNWKKGNSLSLIGTALNFTNYRTSITKKTALIISGFTKKDFQTMQYFRGRGFYFVKQTVGKNVYGRTINIYHFSRTPTRRVKLQLKKFKKSKFKIDKLKNDLEKIYELLKPYEILAKDYNRKMKIKLGEIELDNGDLYIGGIFKNKYKSNIIKEGFGTIIKNDGTIEKGKWINNNIVTSND